MSSKPVLMIHQISEEMFDLPLQDYVLTFDDGLYGHYYFFEQFKQIPTEKIYFISTAFICNGRQSTAFPDSRIAQSKAMRGDMEDFLTVDQIKEMMQDPLVSIGGHGHEHVHLDSLRTLNDVVKSVYSDIPAMLEWFKTNLDFTPTKYCYPYNNNVNGVYTSMLKKFGLTEFYGDERIPVETLLHN